MKTTRNTFVDETQKWSIAGPLDCNGTISSKPAQQAQASRIQRTQIRFPNVGCHSRAEHHSSNDHSHISLYYFILFTGL